MRVTNLAEVVARKLGRAVTKAAASSGPAILAGGLFFAGSASGEVLFSENFESLKLKEAQSNSEDLTMGDVWTDELPKGWSRDNKDTPLPDPDNPDVGPEEFYGFTFVDKAWWIATAGDQDRSFFTLGQGTVMVADADEYDDQDKVDGRGLNENGNVDVPGSMNVFVTTSPISLVGYDKASARLSFDSSFRPYDLTAGLVDVSFDNGTTWKNLLTLDLDSFGGVNSSLERADENVRLNMGAPANATSAQVRFGLVDTGNDWWWAVDNIVVTADASGKPGDFDGDGLLSAADIDALSAEVRQGTNAVKFDVTGDKLVNQQDRETWVNSLKKTYFGDADLDGVFVSSDFVQVFAAGQYEDGVAKNSTWGTGDWSGDSEFDSSDFVVAFQAGGYEAGPRAAVAAVPEPSTGLLALFAAGCAGWFGRRRRRS